MRPQSGVTDTAHCCKRGIETNQIARGRSCLTTLSPGRQFPVEALQNVERRCDLMLVQVLLEPHGGQQQNG